MKPETDKFNDLHLLTPSLYKDNPEYFDEVGNAQYVNMALNIFFATEFLLK
jgi:hypothetical protein